ncbi:MFS transporter [Microbacterium sp. B2969]|uniref:MFS transporter n=1 Tax=Microbacterium alkaliflavum TaxID=3248839 RepID=A0ABW7QEK6_9MICO
MGTQTLFNVGFYAVVPFVAVVLSGDFGLAATTVGLVLGVRTFAQQGMFLVGGALADRIGARATILIGCAIRVTGFLAWAGSLWSSPMLLWLFIAGTVTTGLGGALFSPALNTLVADADARIPGRRVTLFAWLTLSGEVGAVIGPLLGTLLLPLGFEVVAATGAACFAVIGVALASLLPRTSNSQRRDPPARRGSIPALHDPRFVMFAALHAVDLLAYNQLYLTLPLELDRIGTGPELIGVMFAWVSILTLTLQLPVARWCSRVGARTALRAGYLASAGAFTLLAGEAVIALAPGIHLAMIGVAVSGLTFGHLAANPTALSLVPGFASGQPTGSYFGLLASLGGLAVLVGNLAVGRLLDGAAGPSGASALPWLLLTAPMLASALLIPRAIPREQIPKRPG